MTRMPVVAGQFYPGGASELEAMVAEFTRSEAAPRPALVAVCPHAGYPYSGPTAGKVLARVAIPRRVILLGPNHRGAGAPVALMSRGQWLTPLGRVDLDPELGAAVLQACPLAVEDEEAHRFEHSLEVMVPFLQYLRKDLLLTPLCLGWLDYEQCAELGRGLASVIRLIGEPVLIVASTDMTHYESAQAAKAKDSLAIERILGLDPRGLYKTVRGQGITMCGVLPTTAALVAARELGASRAELVEYTNSGAATGDYRQVVGYAGLIVS